MSERRERVDGGGDKEIKTRPPLSPPTPNNQGVALLSLPVFFIVAPKFATSDFPLDRFISPVMWPWRSKESGNSGGSSSSSKPAPPIDDRAEASSPPSTPPLPSTSSPPSPSTPSARLSAAWRAATARVSPGDPIPPRPPQLGEWAANTVLCAGAGAAFCGWREAAAEAAATTATAGAAAAAAPPPPGSTSKAASAAVARAIAEEKTRKLVRIGSEAIR